MTCFEIGYYTLLEDALWLLCLLPGAEKICERMINELKYYYRMKDNDGL